MADQISIRIDETLVNAGSAISATVNFRSRSTAAASTPTSIRYRVDCLTTGRQVINWTSVSAASSVTITIPGTSNEIVDSANSIEVRQIHVIADYGLSTQIAASKEWRVRKILNFPSPVVFEHDSRLEPYFPITDAEQDAGLAEADLSTQYVELDVRRYGGIGDDDTDCLDAFDTAYDVALAKAANDHGAEIFVPEGKFRFSDEWNVYRANSPRLDITLGGVDQLNTILVANFYGAGKSLIKCVDPDGTSRASPLSIRDIGFENVSTSGGVNPVFFNVLGWGESRIDRVRFASSNNTHLRAVSSQNVRGTDVVSFFGGRHFNYKSTSGFTFTVDTTANTITASAAIFEAADEGKHFFIFPSNVANRIRYTLDNYVSSTVIGYTETSNDISATNASGHFEPARCSMTAGDATLTANSACFTSDMVGLVIYVRKAADGSYGDALLRATITGFNSTSSVELDVTPDNNITDEYFAVACFDFGLADGFDGSSDVQIDKLHIEHYDGVAFVAQNTDSYMISGKIHGETSPTDSAKSMAACWLDDFGGKFEVNLDSSCSMSDTRVYACNFNDMTLFDAVWSRHIINGTLVKSELFTDAGGYLIVRGLNLYDNADDPADLISDANKTADATDPRILLEGAVNMLGDASKARIYAGTGAYFDPDGTLRLSGTNGRRIHFLDEATKEWSIGNTTGGGLNFTIRDESTGASRLQVSGTTGATVPGANATLDLGSTSAQWADGYFAARLYVGTYTVATLPAATRAAGLIYVSDETGGPVLAFSDGTNWRRVTDRSIVA